MRDLVDELLAAKVKATLFGGDHAPRLGRLVVLDRLGGGAMGTVFAAYDPRLERRVAVKLLRGGARDELLREARALGKLAHPNVVAVHDVGVEDDVVYLVMELAPGVPLRAWIGGSHDWRAVLSVMQQVGAGIAAAHRAGIVHRDLKPDNALVGDDRARVVDFGLAADSDEATSLAGTPGYLAPELVAGSAATAASDQFAFGVTFHEALHGVRPPSTGARDVPAWLAAIVARTLAADPVDRFATMDDVLAAMDRDRSVPRAYLVAAALAVAGTIAIVATRSSSSGEACNAIDPSWSPAIAARVTSATAPWGERTAATLAATSSRWVATRREVCEATRVRGEQSDRLLELRMRCLDRAHDRFVALVGALDGPALSATVRATAVTAAASLPDAELCTSVVDAARPVDPVLDRAWAAYALGRYADARTALGPVTGDRPAEVLALDAAIEARVGKTASARERLLAALVAASAADARGLELEIWANLMRQELFGGTPAKVLEWDAFAHAAAARAGRDGAELDAIVGEALRDEGRLAEARVRLQRALASTSLRPDRRALATMNLGSIALASGDLAGAEAALTDALGQARAMLGDNHPELAIYIDKLAALDRARGRLAAARTAAERSLAIRVAAFGDSDRSVATSLLHRAEVEIDAGDLRAANADLDRARGIRVAAFGEHSARLGEIDATLGDLAVAQANPPAARIAYALAAVEDPRLDLAARRYGVGDRTPAVLAALASRGITP